MLFAASLFTIVACDSPASEAEDVREQAEEVAEEQEELREEVQEYKEEMVEGDTTVVN